MKCSEHCGWLTSPLISFYNWLQIKGRIGLFKENTSPPTSDSPGMGCCRGGMPNFSEKILFFSLNKRDRIPFFVFHLSEYEEKSPFFADSHLSIVVGAILVTKGINLREKRKRRKVISQQTDWYWPNSTFAFQVTS